MFKKMLSAFSVGALALSLLFAKEAKADQVTGGRRQKIRLIKGQIPKLFQQLIRLKLMLLKTA